MIEWYYRSSDGSQVGPVDRTGLQKAVRAGSVHRSTLVWNATMGNWTPAGAVDALAELFVPPPPPAPSGLRQPPPHGRPSFTQSSTPPVPPAPAKAPQQAVARAARPTPIAGRSITSFGPRRFRRAVLLGCGGLVFFLLALAFVVPNVLRSDTRLNESSAIATCQIIDEAEQIFAMTDEDGDGVREYAAAIVGDRSLWESVAGLDDRTLVTEAIANAGRPPGDPKRAPHAGYFFRILTEQGAKAPGGAYSYYLNNDLALGYAILAWPHEYGRDGKTSYLVGPTGQMWEKDLGEITDTYCSTITAASPLEGWSELRKATRVFGYSRAVWQMTPEQVEVANNKKLTQAQSQKISRVGELLVYTPAIPNPSGAEQESVLEVYFFSNTQPPRLLLVHLENQLSNDLPGVVDEIVKIEEDYAQGTFGPPVKRNPLTWGFRDGSGYVLEVVRRARTTTVVSTWISPTYTDLQQR